MDKKEIVLQKLNVVLMHTNYVKDILNDCNVMELSTIIRIKEILMDIENLYYKE
jgi:hypothetical protein